jgi:uncharacterized Zn finger protein
VKIINLKAKSSSDDYYQVLFEITKVIKVGCDCKAGTFGKLCKHKTGFLSGDRSFLYDLTEEEMLEELMTFVKRSEYSRLTNELISADKAVDAAKAYMKKIKHNVELVLKEGISIKVEN